MHSFLFFTPFAGRTGSEMFLWYMLSRFNRQKIQASLLSECRGDLLDQMAADIKTFVSLKYPGKIDRLKQFVARKLSRNLYDEHILHVHNAVKPDFWYLNTVLMADKVALARRNHIPVVMHFHELTGDYSLISSKQLIEAIDYASVCIGDSETVCNKLKILGARKIALQYECIDTSKISIDESKTLQLKQELGLSKFNFIWLMSGTSVLRKGVDMVPALAHYLKKQNAALVWLGNNTRTGMDYMIEKELAYSELDNVFFLGKRSADYYDYMNLMDGFVLTSREEPFGMVVVEALALGKPVVAFNAGGVTEIITPGTGIIVDSWNLSDLAGAMEDMAKGRIAFDPETARQRAMDFDVSRQVKNWEDIVCSL